jgi:hypothetical protein
LASGGSPLIISRTKPAGNQGQSRNATRIDVNERLRNRGKAISNEKKKDALGSLSASLHSNIGR